MPSPLPLNQVRCAHPFFIAFIGRSGSTHFHYLLNQHPDIHCYKEVFNPVAFWGLKSEAWKRLIKKAMGRTLLRTIRLWEIYGRESPTSRGFTYKIAKDFESFPEVYDWLRYHAPAMKCIFLERKNHLRGAISLQNFKRHRKKLTANLDAGFKGDITPLTVDIPWAIEETQWRATMTEKYYAELSQKFSVHRICYEDLITHQHQELNACFSFLGLPTIDDPDFFEHKTRQISEKNLQDYVTNYDALQSALTQAGLDHYLKI